MAMDFIQFVISVVRDHLRKESAYYIALATCLLLILPINWLIATRVFHFPRRFTPEEKMASLGRVVKPTDARRVSEVKAPIVPVAQKRPVGYLDGSLVEAINSSKGEDSALGNLLKEDGLGAELDQELGKVQK
jgi:hypothetical protein